MKLYYFPQTSNNRKVLAVVHHLDLAPQMQVVNLLEDEQLRPEFLKLNPNHKTPTLEDGDFVLWESNAIMQYLAGMVPGNALWWPAEPRLRCDISRWQCWELAHWHGQACGPLVFENVVKRVFGRGEPDPAVVAQAETAFHRFAAVLEGHLKGRQWLVGGRVTLADFAVAAPLMHAEDAGFPLEGYGEIRRWYDRVEALEAWQKSAPPPRVFDGAFRGGQAHAVHAAHLPG
jgi:glutathione S-transferase